MIQQVDKLVPMINAGALRMSAPYTNGCVNDRPAPFIYEKGKIGLSLFLVELWALASLRDVAVRCSTD